MKEKYSVDGVMPVFSGDVKITYRSDDMNSNRLLNIVMGGHDLQITKIDDDMLCEFLGILKSSGLEMIGGESALVWLRDRLRLRYEQSLTQVGGVWEELSRRYEYIISKIDMMIVINR